MNKQDSISIIKILKEYYPDAKERALHLDLSYRERYLEQLHKAGLDGRHRPLKKE